MAIGITAVWILFILTALFVLTAGEDPSSESPWGGGFNSLLVPAPLEFALLQLLIAPLQLSRNPTIQYPLDRFVANLETMWLVSWLPLMILFALSTMLAAWCYMRHQRYSKHGAASWALFVFLFGLPGFIGYLLHRHWPVMEKCQHCGEITPRDRDACLDCGTEFPLPPLKGIEIFA
jgi:hypothetical protein